jgi:hypothetical protein
MGNGSDQETAARAIEVFRWSGGRLKLVPDDVEGAYVSLASIFSGFGMSEHRHLWEPKIREMPAFRAKLLDATKSDGTRTSGLCVPIETVAMVVTMAAGQAYKTVEQTGLAVVGATRLGLSERDILRNKAINAFIAHGIPALHEAFKRPTSELERIIRLVVGEEFTRLGYKAHQRITFSPQLHAIYETVVWRYYRGICPCSGVDKKCPKTIMHSGRVLRDRVQEVCVINHLRSRSDTGMFDGMLIHVDCNAEIGRRLNFADVEAWYTWSKFVHQVSVNPMNP